MGCHWRAEWRALERRGSEVVWIRPALLLEFGSASAPGPAIIGIVPLDPPNVRVKLVLKGAAKQEVRSPDPIPRPEAEDMIAAIRKAQAEKSEVELTWLTVSGSDVTAAYIEIDPNDPQRTPEEIITELEKMGVVTRDKPSDDG